MAETTQATEPKSDAIVYETEQGQQIRMSWKIVQDFVLKTATREAAYAFMGFCRSTRLDPFKREVFLTEYKPGEYSIITAYQVFMKRATRNPRYKGFKAGIVILKEDDKQAVEIPVGPGGAVAGIAPAPFVCLEGSLVPPKYVLCGGWCQVTGIPPGGDAVEVLATSVVDVEEYIGRKQDGTPNKMWSQKQATMIRKVPVGQAHRDAFPDELQGMYLEEEMQRRGAETAKQAEGATVVARGPIDPPPAEEPEEPSFPDELLPSFQALGWRPAEMVMWVAQQGDQTVEELLLRLEVVMEQKGVTMERPVSATPDTPASESTQEAAATGPADAAPHPDQLQLPA